MPTTMLLRLAVVPLRVVIVALPFVVVPARLKVIGAPECPTVGVCDNGTVPLPLTKVLETVVADGMPLLELVTTIPCTTQVLAVLTTEVSCAVVFQLPVVLHAVGSV